MIRGIKGIFSIIVLAVDNRKKYLCISVILLLVICLMQIQLFSMNFYLMPNEKIINELYDGVFPSLNFILDNISRLSVYFLIISRLLQNHKSNYKMVKAFEFLPVNKEIAVLSRFINLMIVAIFPMIMYFGLYMIKVDNFYGIGVRGVVSLVFFIFLIYLSLRNVTMFFKRDVGEKIVRVLAISVYILPILILSLYSTSDVVMNITNVIHSSDFIHKLGTKSTGIYIGVAVFSIFLFFNYWYVRRQVYKKGE